MLLRIGLVAAVGALIGGLYVGGFFELIDEPERVRTALESMGIWAPVLYVAAFALLEPFFVPGLAFIIPGALYFSFPQLFVLSWLGSIGAGIVGFSFARFLARDFVEERMPERLRRHDEQLATRGLRTVILIRLTLFLAPPAHWLLGMSQVRFPTFVLGTAIGFMPTIALISYVTVFLGQSIGDWLENRPPGTFAVAIIAIVVVVRVRRRIAARRAERNAAEDPPNEDASGARVSVP